MKFLGSDHVSIIGYEATFQFNKAEYEKLTGKWRYCIAINNSSYTSICSVQHALVHNCWFTNTRGTLPKSGVDIEPYRDFQRIEDVFFENCRFTGNAGNNIQLSINNLTTDSAPVDITFINCYSENNHDTNHPNATSEINTQSASAKEPVSRSVIL